MFPPKSSLFLLNTLLSLLALFPHWIYGQQLSAEQVAARFSLTTSTTLPFPSATQSSQDTENLLVSQWSLGKGRVQDSPGNLAFVADPFPDSTTPTTGQNSSNGPVLQVKYAAGAFGSADSGSQWYNLWNATDGSKFQTMLVSYEVAFDRGFEWVKGGKLPGIRGGLQSTGCSGGNEADGKDCFSVRLMWRKNAAGEVYGYIPTRNGLCDQDGIICNSDFGTSIQRESFGFVDGRWNRISLLVRLNDPPNIANGNIQLYYNDLLAIDQQNLQIHSDPSLSANGFYFSTFFGGADASWAPSKELHTYYRNIQLWAGSAPSNLTGKVVSAAGQAVTLDRATEYMIVLLACAAAVAASFI